MQANGNRLTLAGFVLLILLAVFIASGLVLLYVIRSLWSNDQQSKITSGQFISDSVLARKFHTHLILSLTPRL
jgi:hypothetical protein